MNTFRYHLLLAVALLTPLAAGAQIDWNHKQPSATYDSLYTALQQDPRMVAAGIDIRTSLPLNYTFVSDTSNPKYRRAIQTMMYMQLTVDSVWIAPEKPVQKFVRVVGKQGMPDSRALRKQVQSIAGWGRQYNLTLVQLGLQPDGHTARVQPSVPMLPSTAKMPSSNCGLAGSVTDQYGNPIPYATIAIVTRQTGTLADSTGRFCLPNYQPQPADSMTVSCAGYASKSFAVAQFTAAGQADVQLQDKAVQLAPVAITATQSKPITLGIKRRETDTFGYIYGAKIGAEAGRILSPPQGSWYLRNVRFYLHNSDSVPQQIGIRVYSYDEATKQPGTNLLPKTVLASVPPGSHWVDVDVTTYMISGTGPLLVSFQWLSANVQNPTVGLAGDNADSDVRYKSDIGKTQWQAGGSFNWMIQAELGITR